MRHARSIAVGLAAISLVMLAGGAAAQPAQQEPTPSPVPPTAPTAPGAPTLPPGTVRPTPTKDEQPEAPPPVEAAPEPPRVPEDLLQTRTPVTDTPRVFVGPDLFNPPAHQGWITITPSLTLSAEYNDNIFLSSGNRKDDVVFGITPGVTLTMRRPNYRLSTGFRASGQLYLDESELNDFGKSTRFFADWSYQMSPTVSFALVDDFVYSRDSSEITSGGVSVGGQQDAWRNTITPSARWQATQNTGLSLYASHTIIRLEENTESERDSDTFRLGLIADHQLTARLTGTLGIEGAYIDASGEPSAWGVTPKVGLSYAVTPTLRVFGNAGPTFLERGSDTSVTPAVSVGLTQTYKFGFLQLGYDRAVTADTIGVSDSQIFFGSLVVPTLLRGLQLEFTPRYAIVDPEERGRETVDTLTLNLTAKYRIVRNISVIGSYTFFHQTFDRTRNADLDQNRVFLGLQYAYPISIY
jgi:hypothetical protein